MHECDWKKEQAMGHLEETLGTWSQELRGKPAVSERPKEEPKTETVDVRRRASENPDILFLLRARLQRLWV